MKEIASSYKIDKVRHRLSQKELIILVFLLLFTFNYIFKYYLSVGAFRILIYFMSFSFAVFGVLSYQNTQGKMRIGNSFELSYLIVYVYIVLNSVIHLFASTGVSGKIEGIAIYMAILSAFFYKRVSLNCLEKTFIVAGILSIIAILYVTTQTNFNVDSAIGREYQWDEIFYYAPMFWYSPPFVILSIVRNKNKAFSIIILAVEIVLNLVIVKRIILLKVASLGMVVLYLTAFQKNKVRKFLQIVFMVTILLFAVIYFVGDVIVQLYDSVLQRTITSAGDISTFNRFEESIDYLKEAGILKIVFGGGFSASHTALGYEASALHVGWGNFVLKGGIFLLVLAIVPYVKVVKMISKLGKQNERKLFSLGYLLYMFPMLFLSNMHSFEPTMFLFYFCCLNVLKKDHSYAEVER